MQFEAVPRCDWGTGNSRVDSFVSLITVYVNISHGS